MTFPVLVTTRAGPEQAKLITELGWPDFALETYPHCFECSSYSLSSVLLKFFFIEFWLLFRARALLEQVKLKTGPEWLSFGLEIYPHSLWSSSYYFRSVQLKNVSIEFWRLFQA